MRVRVEIDLLDEDGEWKGAMVLQNNTLWDSGSGDRVVLEVAGNISTVSVGELECAIRKCANLKQEAYNEQILGK